MSRFNAPIAEQIWDMKYRFKNQHGEAIDENVEATWERIAHALSQSEDIPVRKSARRQFYEALDDFKFLPAGRITAGAGTDRSVTLFNCFVMGTIPDSMDGIFSMLREAALTMQQGGGIGYDFSTIRPRSAWVRGVDSDASGPLSFMDVWDAMCRTVMSAGSRRGAMMATMRCDHPDIMDFITAKSDPNRLRMFNLSVLATDKFMKAVKEDAGWNLVHDEPPKGYVPGDEEPDGLKYVYETIRARDLWDAMMQHTYDAAEPGVIFIDRINRDNNLNYCETISATNPCGEQPLPPYGACLLGSINLARLVVNAFTEKADINDVTLQRLVGSAVRMMDNVVDVSNFPLEAQRIEAQNKRRIGLGVTGLADALAMCCIRYGSKEAGLMVSYWMKTISHAAYRASIDLAREKGAFPLFDADEFLKPGTHASRLPKGMQDDIREDGIRNALLTSVAPTGTISLYAGNVSSGIEPMFDYGYTRKVLQPDGTKTEEIVEDYAVSAYRDFWYTHHAEFMPDPDNGRDALVEDFDPRKHLPDYFVTAQTLDPLDHVRMQAAAQEHVDSSISKTINCPEDISFEDFKEVYMTAYDMGCKGCTTYRPNEITGSILSAPEKPKKEPAKKGNLTVLDERGETLFMGVTTSVEVSLVGPEGGEWADYLIEAEPLELEDPFDDQPEMGYAERGAAMLKSLEVPEEDLRQPYGEDLPERGEELEGSTYKIKVGDQKAVYLTINDTVESDGTVRPFEIFMRSSDPTHDEWMVAVSRLVSAIMRRPYDSSFVGRDLMRISSAVTGGFQRGHGYRASLVAAIGAKIKEHCERCARMTASEQDWDVVLDADGKLDIVKAMKAVKDDMMGTEEMKEAAIAQLEAATRTPPVNPVINQSVKPCPKCNSYNIKFESGCATCRDCGHSKCG